MKFLFTKGGRPSMSKTWTNISYGVATFVVVRNADNPSWELMLVYLAVVGASEIAKRVLEAKNGIASQSGAGTGGGSAEPAAGAGGGVEGVLDGRGSRQGRVVLKD